MQSGTTISIIGGCSLAGLVLLAASEALLTSRPALAQVSADEWFFEIDGDYGSVLGPEHIPSSSYTIPSRNITDGEGVDRHSTYAPRQGYAVADQLAGICGCENSGLGNVCVVHYDACSAGLTPTCNPQKGANGGGCGGCTCQGPACTNWWHEPSAPYMGKMSYGVECRYVGERSVDENAEPRRSEQMLLRDWCPDSPDNSQRYFSLAFRLVDLPVTPVQGTSGFMAQLHQGPYDPIPFRMKWEYLCPQGLACSYYLTMGGYDSNKEFYEFGPTIVGSKRKGIAVPLNVWTRMLFRFSTPGAAAGEARVWRMDNSTGTWSEVGYHSGEVGSTSGECNFQWKVGLYSNESDAITIDYDNVAYGKRWNAITKNRLIGYHKSVLNLSFDEGQGATVHDRSWAWNGGQQGDPTRDYDNDGQIQGNVTWSMDGVGTLGHSLRFNGGSVSVPMDTTDFDFGNYVTVSAWFKTTERHTDHQGLVSIDEDALGGKLFLAKSDDKLSFGVRHPDDTYSEVIYAHEPSFYSDGQWHHVVGTFNRFTDDNRRVMIYVDGERKQQRVGGDWPILRGDTRLVVGKFSTSGYFVGNIDEVNVLNYALTDADVATLYSNLGRPDSRE